jgi:hypothetical protein
MLCFQSLLGGSICVIGYIFVFLQIDLYISQLMKDTKTEHIEITPNFIDLVNKLGSKYTFVFANGDLYILLSTSRDKFIFGALNKSINDVSQYALFKQDIKEVLNIVNKVKNIEYLSCPTEEDWKLFE